MSPLSSRRSRSVHALVVALLAAMSVSSCGGADKPGEQAENRSEATDATPVADPDVARAERRPLGLHGVFGSLSATPNSPHGCTTTPRHAISPPSSR